MLPEPSVRAAPDRLGWPTALLANALVLAPGFLAAYLWVYENDLFIASVQEDVGFVRAAADGAHEVVYYPESGRGPRWILRPTLAELRSASAGKLRQIELWREDEFVGMVFWDDDVPVVQIYAEDDGDVKDLDLRELWHALGRIRLQTLGNYPGVGAGPGGGLIVNLAE